LGNLKVCNKICLHIDDKKTWIFHGDVFDASVQHSKWIAKLGGKGYDLLIVINNIVNWFLEKMGKEKYSFSKKIKNNVKKAVKYIGDFELTASELAIDNHYDYVVKCLIKRVPAFILIPGTGLKIFPLWNIMIKNGKFFTTKSISIY
jgi:UDP-2,3-diacylglucosamine pyrophosphatase LpxH